MDLWQIARLATQDLSPHVILLVISSGTSLVCCGALPTGCLTKPTVLENWLDAEVICLVKVINLPVQK